MPELFRKRPVVIQAEKLSKDNAEELARWCGGRVVEEQDALDRSTTYVGVNIPTLEGVMRASEGDYIVKGVEGEFYPCKPGIFESTYDKV